MQEFVSADTTFDLGVHETTGAYLPFSKRLQLVAALKLFFSFPRRNWSFRRKFKDTRIDRTRGASSRISKMKVKVMVFTSSCALTCILHSFSHAKMSDESKAQQGLFLATLIVDRDSERLANLFL